MKKIISALLALLLLFSTLTGCGNFLKSNSADDAVYADLGNIPDFNGVNPYVKINNNVPFFEESEITTKSFESYSPLDSLGRCGTAIACVGIDIMPTEDRESISSVTPTGWLNVKYDIVSGEYLYNRAHLIAFQLTGENANKENIITGTRFMNADGMLPFENMVADYVKETENHVMYRVTPIFEGKNLVASGVLMEALSVEDGGKAISFCVYVYNNQPGIVIDYSNGKSRLATEEEMPDAPTDTEKDDTGSTRLYIINTNSNKFHTSSCKYALSIKVTNRIEATTTKEDLIHQGYNPCNYCLGE